MGTTNSVFTGTSSFSQDFQNVLTKAVTIASLPITQLTYEQTTLTNQNTALTTLNRDFTSLQSAVEGIDQAVNSSFNTNVSAPTVVTAAAGANATEGNYSILVSNAGTYSSAITNTWTGTSKGTADSYQLSIGTQAYSVTPKDNSAASVAAAINASYGSLVEATVVNVGSTAAPDYRISLQSANLTSSTLDLQDKGTSLIASKTAGQPAQYEVDGSGSTVSSGSPNVTVATGVTLTLLASSTDPVNVTVTRSTSAVSNALQTFVTAYNQARIDVDAHVGLSGGALEGQPIVSELSQVLSSIATYSASGTVSGLADLGLTLGDNGQFTFNSLQMAGEDLMDSTSVTSFLGAAPGSAGGSGSGFLLAATNAVNSAEDTPKGLIPATQSDWQTQLTSLATEISDKQAQVDQMQTNLTNQMDADDASIANMEQQFTYLSSMFQAMQTAEQTYNA